MGAKANARTEKKSPTNNDNEKSDTNIRISSAGSKFVYADVAKHLLAKGSPYVELSALGAAIADAVAVAEMLRNQGMIVVKKIETSRNVENARRKNTDKICITVAKAKEFDAKYAELQKQRDERKAAKESEKN
jgi:DNA-binding protein